jgi:hypothetical protein
MPRLQTSTHDLWLALESCFLGRHGPDSADLFLIWIARLMALNSYGSVMVPDFAFVYFSAESSNPTAARSL